MGATFFRTGAGGDSDPYPHSELVELIADGEGGAYALVQLCNPFLPHTRCREVSVMRLMHVAADGDMYPGWPAEGVALDGYYPSLASSSVGVVGDGQGGVILAWLTVLAGADPPSTSVVAQRYAPGGAPMWPSAAQGVEVLAAGFPRISLGVAGDRAGGAAIVVTTYTATTGRTDLLASRVLADGSLPWGSSGRVVIQQPDYAATLGDVALDPGGNLFITSSISAMSGSFQRVQCNQLLGPDANPRYGVGGRILFPAAPFASSAAFAGGYVCMYQDANGRIRFQSQDDVGTPHWGSGPAGMFAQWSDPSVPLHPVTTSDGHVVSVWESPAGAPTPFVRAMELNENGQPLPDWPALGLDVCGYASGRVLADVLSDRGSVFVALGSSELSSAAPLVQRLSRAVLDVEPEPPAGALELSAPSPNPSRGAWSVRFTLRATERVTLEVLDVSGRRVLAEDLGTFAPGTHAANPALAAALPPGLYDLRVRAGTHVARRTLVRIR